MYVSLRQISPRKTHLLQLQKIRKKFRVIIYSLAAGRRLEDLHLYSNPSSLRRIQWKSHREEMHQDKSHCRLSVQLPMFSLVNKSIRGEADEQRSRCARRAERARTRTCNRYRRRGCVCVCNGLSLAHLTWRVSTGNASVTTIHRFHRHKGYVHCRRKRLF